MACLTAWPPITAPWVWLKLPRTDLARPVRAVETMTACFMVCPFGSARKLARRGRAILEPGRRGGGIAQCQGNGEAQGDDAYGDADIERCGQEGHRRIGQG